MEAVPRLPMISFELKTSTEPVSFGPQLKQYIATFYNEDPESYNTEINNLESLRGAAVRPSIDVTGCQLLKKYYCQLHFLKSRFPMGESQSCAVYFSWKDSSSNMPYKVPDINYELMCVLYNIGALHSQLGALDPRTTPEGMKMACTHFQCAAWAFQTVKETYYQMVTYTSCVEVIHCMQQVCLAQAQECILEKSMMDNRKATIIAKVAVQVADYYRRSLTLLQSGSDECSFSDIIGSRTYKEWVKYLSFKVSYHKCIALLFQGQQAEEQQKMGERVAFYQAACEQLEEARKLASSLKQQKEIAEALAFTSDVVEGKRKAAKNENEFIYHEEVPDKHALQEVKGASLVKGIPFNVNDIEVSGPDIFQRLVPMEAHEASSLYSEKKAQMLRQIGELIESKDQALAEFMSSMQLDIFNQMRQATGLSQEIIDRAAALSAKPTAIQDLINLMGKLSNSYHEVESMLNEIQELLKIEEQNEKEYQEVMGKRPPSIIITDLSREASKYREAHNKANDSNQTLHKAMTTHVANLKILSQPLQQLKQQIPSVEFPNTNIDDNCIKEIDNLIGKVDEMRNQRAMLWTQLRESVHQDDITNVLVTRSNDQPLDQLFQQELQKHQQLTSLIEQNAVAQENILKAFVDVYARSTPTRRYLQEIVGKRNSTINALIASYDTYDDLVAKANKGIEFYNKLETNVSKLLQRIKSACKVQQEERDEMLGKNSRTDTSTTEITPASTQPKLKDYLDTRKKTTNRGYTEAGNLPQYYLPQLPQQQQQNIVPESWPPAVRPTPVGSEVNINDNVGKIAENSGIQNLGNQSALQGTQQYPQQYENNRNLNYDQNVDQNLSERMSALRTHSKIDNYQMNYYPQYYPNDYSNYNYSTNNSGVVSNVPTTTATNLSSNNNNTNTTNTYQTISSTTQNQQISSTSDQCYSNYYYPGYQQTTLQNYSGVNYVTPEYSTSVRPDIVNQNCSTYSSPITQMKSSISDNQQGYETITNTQQYLQNYGNQLNYDAYGNYYTANFSQQQQYPGNAYNYTTQTVGSIPSTETVVTTTANLPQQQQQQQYPGNVYNYTTPISQSFTSLPATTTTTDFSQQQYPCNVYNYTTPTYPTVSSTNVVTTTTTTTTSFPQQYPDSVYNYTQSTMPIQSNLPQYPTNVYNYTTPTPVSSVQPTIQNVTTTTTVIATTTTTTTKESNLDLLTGLDFTINQAPLIPQQNPLKTEIIDKPSSPNKTENQQAKQQQQQQQQPKTEKKQELIKRDTVKVSQKFNDFRQLDNDDVKYLFSHELEKYEKFIDVLNNKTLNGPTNLDLKWKEIQDNDVQKRVISVARCYPMKNRFPDILPYDYTRVELKNSKDDYINASYIQDVSNWAPDFIVTQLPLQSTIIDFWTMICEQQIELIVCLLNDNEIGNEKYWPISKNQDLNIGNMVISLMKEIVKPYWIERTISIYLPEKRDSRVVMHLQFTAWPGSLFPTTPESFLNLTSETINLYQQQRNLSHPIVVHCNSGIGRSGLLCLLMIAIMNVVNQPKSIPDLVLLTIKLCALRRNILRDREHLKFAFETFLLFMKQTVTKGRTKKMISGEGNEEKQKSNDTTKPDDDPLSSLDPFWASKKGN